MTLLERLQRIENALHKRYEDRHAAAPPILWDHGLFYVAQVPIPLAELRPYSTSGWRRVDVPLAACTDDQLQRMSRLLPELLHKLQLAPAVTTPLTYVEQQLGLEEP